MSLVIRKMKVNIMRYFIPIRLIKIKRLIITSLAKNVEHRELSYIASWVYLSIHFGESLVKWNTHISFDPGIPLLGLLYSTEILQPKHQEICLRFSTATLFRIPNK